MSQVQSTQPTSRMFNPTIVGAAVLATALAAFVIVGAFLAFSAARTPAIGTSSATVQSVDGWEKALLQARAHRVQDIRDGWEQPLLGARLARVQAIQDGWEPVLLAQQTARIARAQSIQDAWEVALFR